MIATGAGPWQLAFAALDQPAQAEPLPIFVRGVTVDRRGIAQYAHLVRGPVDPERSPRPPGGREDRAPHRTLATATLEDCRAQILGLLGDGRPRTFNAIGVELLDHTANTLFRSPYDRAVWQLVDEGTLEHTLDVPILFRVARAL